MTSVITTYPCSSDDQKSLYCKRTGRKTCKQCACDEESVRGRLQDGISGDACQGAVTMLVLETYCAGRAVVEWEPMHCTIELYSFGRDGIQDSTERSVSRQANKRSVFGSRRHDKQNTLLPVQAHRV